MPNLERMGGLLSSWVYFMDGDTTHAKHGQWVVQFLGTFRVFVC